MTAVTDASSRRIVIAMVTLNAFTTPVMLSATNVALPAISEHFALSATMLSWVPMAYLMASAMFILICGRLADLFGRKRVFLLGTAAVILSSAFTGLAANGAMLLGGRFLQGLSAAMLYATQVAIVSSVFPPSQRGKAIGLVVSAVYAGLMTGPVLGGVVTDYFGWRANFYLHIPLSLVVLFIGLGLVREEWAGERVAFDFAGAALFSLAILLLCLGVSLLPSIASAIVLSCFAVSLFVFVRHAGAVENPIWDIRLFFGNALFTRSCGASLIMYTATYANLVLLSLYLQELKSLSASEAGLIMAIQPVSMALLAPVAGRLSDSMEPRVLASSGMLLTALGLFLLSGLDTESPLSTVAAALTLSGVGFGLFSSPNTNAIMSSVDRKDYGIASGAVATTRILGQLGSMVLVALAMSLLIGDRLIDSSALPQLEQSIQFSFSVAAAICLPGILLSAMRRRMHRHGGRGS